MPKKKRKPTFRKPYICFFPLSILSNIILPYLFPQIGVSQQDSSIHYLSKCIKIILQLFHVQGVHKKALTDFIHIYSNNVDISTTSQFLSKVMCIETFQQLIITTNQFKDFKCDVWILPLTELLLDRKANVSLDNNYALRWASEKGYRLTVELLLDRKADVGAYDNYALRWASDNGHTSTVELLIDQKADVGAQNDYALRWASGNGHTSTVELLLDRKADIGANDNVALQLASENGHTSTVELLLDRKADVGAQGNCALRWASYYGHKSTVKLLLDRKADVLRI